jgi:hypothetical protein
VRSRRLCGIVVGGLVAAVPCASSALAQGSGGTAPAYPGNTIQVQVPEPIVAATVVTVRLSGHAQWNEPETDESTIPYSLSMYAQDAAVDGQCSTSYGAQLQKSINLPDLNASTSISGFVLDGDLNVNPAPPANTIDWAGDALPFAIKPGVDRVLLCAYQRYVIDDAAYYQLPVRVEQPACRLKPASVKRGESLMATCNFRGELRIQFKGDGGRKRTATATADERGRARVPTRKLAEGVYRVTITTTDLRVAKQRIRVR